jgi:hypothetical protein
MKAVEKENWENLYSHMKQEGFQYCFDGYSSWSEIKSKKFHKMRKKYLNAAIELELFIINKYEQTQL